ncbi:MAG: phenylalanine--tRNA ligase subunit beta, partial [Chloroflexaceae bacterium]|nr:phenylalanine--tRNA ligase subunit beta [Chloroflexaceae bacterium]
MKVPLSWLREFVDITMSPEALAHLMSISGLEVDEIIYSGVEGAELVWDAEKIVIANILEVRPHPDADRLVLADVDYGSDEPRPHTVVTGAPNLFAYRGQGRLTHPLKSVFAKEGARLYDGHKEGRVLTTLKGRPVRGVMSDAMLCSEKELGISDEHEGIILLEADVPTGVPVRDVLGEVVFDIDITPNMARCLSIIGVAREIAALTGQPLRLPDPQVMMEGPVLAGRAHITIEDPELCPRFTVGLIEGITMGPSPLWMQRRLRHVGMRPINVIVDISNYVMMEWGQPTHAFDAAKVHNCHLIARLAQAGETLVTLDDKERDLTPYCENDVTGPLLVADPQGVLSMAGIMGGADSEVSDSTTDVLLEAANWEPAQIRRTAQHFKLPSEASRRFERGVDIELPLIAQRRALELMRNLAGGTVAEGLLDEYPRKQPPLVLDLPSGEVRRIVGIQLSAHDIADYLERLGFQTEISGSLGIGDIAGIYGGALDPLYVRVAVPSFRRDVTMLADLCEEVARIHGYDNIPTTLLEDEIPFPEDHTVADTQQAVRDLLVGAGLDEVITYSLLDMATVATVNPAEAHAERYVKLANPNSPEREHLRRSLLPSLLQALRLNLQERERVLLFEMGNIYLLPTTPPTSTDPESWLPDQPARLALVLAGPRAALSWQGAPREVLDFFDLKGVLETLLAHLSLHQRVAFVPLPDDERLHPGRAARLMLTQQTDGTPLAEAVPLVCWA